MMIRLLPAQFLLAAVSSVNSIVCSLAAGNLLGAYTMSAVGLYLPVNMFLNAVIAMLQGGTAIQSGKYIGENCHGKEKVRRFREEFGEAQIDAFYSDSHSDDPMAETAKKAFLIKGEEILDWE